MSDSDAIDTFDIKGLNKILKMLKSDKPPVCRVGILGSRDSRSVVAARLKEKGLINRGTLTNATIGAAHEFGTTKIPRRSFLRVPLTDHLQKQIENSGAFKDDVLKEVVKIGTIKPWLQKIGIIAENIVQAAFDTGGDGRWPAHAQGYTNATGKLLIDTQQLRNSITSEVK